jgi:hypothetical protein
MVTVATFAIATTVTTTKVSIPTTVITTKVSIATTVATAITWDFIYLIHIHLDDINL